MNTHQYHNMSNPAKGSYPRQPQPNAVHLGYPTQPYPPQQQYAHAQPYVPSPYLYGVPAGHGMYGVPPPPYTETTQVTAATPASTSFPATQPVVVSPHQAPNYSTIQGLYHQQQHPGQVVQGTFDPGARFGAGATANIPPPPPGYAPNTAQMAVAQGQNIVMHQRQAGWFSGGTDGGYTVW